MSEGNPLTPALSKYAQMALDAMWEESVEEEEGTFWYGGIMALIKRVAPSAHTGSVSNTLKETRAIEMLYRGGGSYNRPRYALYRRRVAEYDDGTPIDVHKPNIYNPSKTDIVEKKLGDLNRQVQRMARRLDALEQLLIYRRANGTEPKEDEQSLAEQLGVEDES